MVVGAKVCELAYGFLWFVCGLYMGILTSPLNWFGVWLPGKNSPIASKREYLFVVNWKIDSNIETHRGFWKGRFSYIKTFEMSGRVSLYIQLTFSSTLNPFGVPAR